MITQLEFINNTLAKIRTAVLNALGYVPENIANKVDTLIGDSDIYYPTQKAVKEYVDDSIPTQLGFFIYDDAGDFGYYKMQLAEPTAPLATIQIDDVVNEQIIIGWITNSGKPNLDKIQEGNHRVYIKAKIINTGAEDVRLRWLLYKRDTANNEELLMTSGYSDYLEIEDKNVWIASYYNDEIVIGVTDRLIIKIQVEVTGTGATPDILFTMEGNSDSRYTLPVSILTAGGDGILNKYDAITAPTANDDSGDGYSVGSEWVDVTADLTYRCVDATLTAAIWKCLSSVIIDDAPSTGFTYGRKDGTWAQIIVGALDYLHVLSSFNTIEPINLTADISITTAVSWS